MFAPQKHGRRTKFMVSKAMQCIKKGLVSLDEDVTRILPGWKSPDILTGFDKETGEPLLKKATKMITLRLLLTHSSGMGYDFLLEKLMTWRKWHKQDVKELEGDIFEPGEGWDYGCGVDWVGQIVGCVNGGVRLGDYMREHIWKPLGLKLTAFQVINDKDILDHLVDLTVKSPSGDLAFSPPMRKRDPKDNLGRGGLYSATSDYIKPLISLLKNDGTLLKRETVEDMFKLQLPDKKYLVEKISDPEAGPMFTSGVKGTAAWN